MMPIQQARTHARPSEPRERILSCAYALFSRRGVRDVGIDEIVAKSGVAKATLYRHFPSKDDLVLAFLQRREELWTLGMVRAGAHERGVTARERLLAIFDVFGDWFNSDDFDGCTFVNVLLEMGWEHPLGRASIECLENIRGIVRDLAEEAGLNDPGGFAHSWHILMKGSIISAAEGDREAHERAKDMARDLLARHS